MIPSQRALAQPLRRRHVPISRKFRLRTALVVPFVLQIVVAVGLVGYLSFKNGQKAIEDLAGQLTQEVSNRIDEHVVAYFDKTHQVLRVTYDAVQSNNLDLTDFERLQRYFWSVVQEGDLESYLLFGNEQGEFVGVEHLEDGTIQLKIRTQATAPIRETYLLDDSGNRAKLLKQAEYDPRKRPWYQAAQQAKKPTWSPIYPFFSRKATNTALGIAAVVPVFDSSQQLQGVLCINITLLRVTEFLTNLYISPHGQSFIIERSGDLVVSSTIGQPFLIQGEGENAKIVRIPAIASNNVTVRATAQSLLKRFGSFGSIQTSQPLKFQVDGAWHYAWVRPIQDKRGIDWLVVVVVPESDFIAQINKNTQITILLCLVALIIATGMGILTARWITRPILRITQASEDMANGNLNQRIKSSSIGEIEKLANAFNSMAGQLKESFETLEDKVNERTAELAQANAEIAALNQRLKSENLRMSAELDILREMQQLILPKPTELEAITDLDIAGFMEPADEVGGDYYDVLYTDGVVTIGIGDVTGHGLESGILMVMTQTAVRTLCEIRESDPVRFLDTLNRTIYKNVERMNSTKNLTLAILNYAEGKISISGQHEETLVVRKGGHLEQIDTIDLGFPIGLEEDIADFISRRLVELEPGDGVVLYTDGITEAEDINGNFYALERLCETIRQNWHLDAEQIKQATINDLRQFIGEQKVFDDITLLVLKVKP
jgi:sigma-B regulation protein RsbU (phosphoserine phosphatase)